MSRIADRITSSSRKDFGMYAKTAALPDQGGLIHMELGLPAHDTPEHIKAATINPNTITSVVVAAALMRGPSSAHQRGRKRPASMPQLMGIKVTIKI